MQLGDAEGRAKLIPGGEASLVGEVASAATPMMRQYLEVKSRFPDCVLFFRLGDFYEMFFDDAVRASEILQITLTARAKGDEKVPMCGVPYHAARGYVAKLVGHGLKVAICDQLEEPGATPGSSVVRRDVTRVVTPGMAFDDELNEPRENRFLAAVAWEAGSATVGLALLDASTGEFRAGVVALADLGEELARAAVREVVLSRTVAGSTALGGALGSCPRPPVVNALDDDTFDPSRAEQVLRRHFGVAWLESFGMGDERLACTAAGAALRYLQDTQRASPCHVDRLTRIDNQAHLVLDEACRQNLELLRTLRDGKRKGSLLGLLDRTVTAMGGRCVARWLTLPLRRPHEIQRRLDAVEELSTDAVLREELHGALQPVADVERLTSRLALSQGNARDLLALRRSLQALPALWGLISGRRSPLLAELAAPLRQLEDLATLLERAVADDPPATTREGGMLRRGFHAQLDELIDAATGGRDFLLQLEARERERTQIASLKVRFNKVFGYFIEVTKANLHLVPADYRRKQTTVGGERFVTDELKIHEERVLSAEERRSALEAELFEGLRKAVVERAPKLRGAAKAVAELDALAAFARCAAEYGYVRPEIDDSAALEIVEGRHPVVERLSAAEPFVPNDVRLDEARQLLIITGPNMAGKSTVMRQAALCAIMAQAGSFVAARRARIGLCDRIFTRVGAADNLARGQSTFMVEMIETAAILHNATPRSLVVLDEIGRGTSTFDGLSIAWAVAEHLHDRVGARTLFATHYHELVDLAREKPRVRNASMAVRETQGRVVFLRRLVEGGASRSYGIEVARLAGLPGSVLVRARDILQNLEQGELDEAGHPQLVHRRRGPARDQLALFAREGSEPPSSAVEQALREVDLDTLTPLQALNLLAGWKRGL